MREFVAHLDEIWTGAQAGFPRRWTACNFFDKAFFAQGSIPPVYWPKGGRALPVPGLPDTTGWDGIEEFSGHLILWKGERFKWCAKNDFTLWIPVLETAVSLAVDTLEDFTHPSIGSRTDWIHIDEDSAMFTVGQFVRIDLNANDPLNASYNFYTVAEVANPVGKISLTEAFPHSFPPDGETYYAFTKLYSEWPEGGRLLDDGAATTLEVVSTSRDVSLVLSSAAQSEEVPAPNGTFHIQVLENPSSLRAGDVVSLGNTSSTGLDLYEVVTVAFNLELRRIGVGTQQQALNYKFPEGTFITFQPFIRATNTGTSAVEIAAESVITLQGALKLESTGSTGEIAVDTVIPAGSSITSLDANDAGESVNAGAQINGDIFAITAVGEYALMLKNRSIQTMQDVGRLNGTFFIRPAVLDEGLISRYAWTRVEGNRIIFWGHKEIYEYGGDLVLTPIGVSHTKEVFEEFDRSRADEIISHHNERDTEVWFVYPTLSGETKVLIYNYREKTVVIDLYDSDLNGITAIGGIDWESAPAWQDLSTSLTWESETKKWYQYVDEGEKRYTILAIGGTAADANLGESGDDPIPRLLLHGRRFSRCAGDNCSPEAYLCKAETQDFDFGDSARWKYADTIILDMEVKERLTRPMKLWVQIGSRSNLDADIVWSAPASVEVSGNGTVQTKVNLRGSGRYHRIRFFSQAVDAQWRVAGFELIARLGGTN
jgi:hypothetical protein